jgi:hypothetical protein
MMTDDKHWPALLELIKKDGFHAHCMSRNHDSGALYSCAVILGGYVIAEDGLIYSPDCVFRETY